MRKKRSHLKKKGRLHSTFFPWVKRRKNVYGKCYSGTSRRVILHRVKRREELRPYGNTLRNRLSYIIFTTTRVRSGTSEGDTEKPKKRGYIDSTDTFFWHIWIHSVMGWPTHVRLSIFSVLSSSPYGSMLTVRWLLSIYSFGSKMIFLLVLLRFDVTVRCFYFQSYNLCINRWFKTLRHNMSLFIEYSFLGITVLNLRTHKKFSKKIIRFD